MRATAIESVSGYVVVVISVLESRAVTLISSYLANMSGRTAVSHLCTRPHATAAFSQRMLDVMPGETHARACLLDHAAELRGVLEDCLDEPKVAVEVSEPALVRAASVWAQRRRSRPIGNNGTKSAAKRGVGPRAAAPRRPG